MFRNQYKKFKSTFEPPTGPSITDKLMHEELKDVVQRFFQAGRIPLSGIPADLEVTNKTSIDDIDKAFDEFETAEVANMDKVERCEALSFAQNIIEQTVRQASKKTSKPLEASKTDDSKKSDIVEGVVQENGN